MLAGFPVLVVAVAVLIIRGELLAVGLLLAAAGAIMMLLRPDTATLLVVFLLYTNAAVVAVKFHGVPFFVGASVPLLLAWPLFWHIVVRGEKFVISPMTWPLILFVVVQLLGILVAQRPDVAAAKMKVAATECLLLYLLVSNAVRTLDTLRRVVWVLIAGGALLGGLGGFQYISGTQHHDYGGFAQVPTFDPEEAAAGDELARFAGSIGEKNYFAQFMLMVLPLAMFRVNGERRTLWRVTAVVCCAFIALGIALTFSRGAVVGFVAMLAVMTMMRYIKVRHALAGVLGLVLLLLAVPQYAARLQSLGRLADVLGSGKQLQHADKATQGRLTEMAAAGLVFVENPILGVGPGMFRYHFLEKADALGFQIHGTTRLAHCVYLEIAAEHGIVGLVAFLAVLLMTLRRLAKVRTSNANAEMANLAVSFMLAIVALMTTGVFLSFAYVRYYWLFLALAASVDIIARSLPSSERDQRLVS
jgi:O-antigen ligase